MTQKKLGRYEIVGELGKGAMGVVYLARDPLIGRSLALKTFRLGYGASGAELEQFRARFLREAQSAGILNHPNIVTIHDVVVEEGEQGVVFIAMEYVKGTDLKQLLKRRERLPLSFTIDVGVQLANGIEYAHQHGVVHRDIKPANIILTKSGQAKITDFGIARIDASNLTVEGQLLGTPNYMAPEQIQGREVDHRADLFSLGVLLYEMVTGMKPFAGENLTMVTHRIVHEPFSPPKESIASLPPGMMAVLDKALRKDPDDRYQRGKELATDLEQLREERRPVVPSSVSFLGAPSQPAAPVPGVTQPAAPSAPPPSGVHELGAETIPPAVPAGVPAPTPVSAHESGAGIAPPAAAGIPTGASVPADVMAPEVESATDVPLSAPQPSVGTTSLPGPIGGSAAVSPPSSPEAAIAEARAAPVPSGTLVAPPPAAEPTPAVAMPASPPAKWDRRLLWGGLVIGVLALAGLGIWLFGGGDRAAGAAQAEAWRSDHAAAQRYLEAGDTRAAVVAFDRALAIHGSIPELARARDQALEKLAAEAAAGPTDPLSAAGEEAPDAEAGDGAAEDDPKAVVAALLEEARSALRDRRYERVLELAHQVNETEPRNRDARRLASAAEDGLARRARAGNRLGGGASASGRTTPRATTPVTPRVAPPPSPQPAPPPPRRRPSTPPPPTARPTPPPASAAAGIAVAIDLESQVAEGILTIYQGQERVYRDRFEFEGSGMFGRGKASGKRQDSVTVPGNQPLKIYLWRQGASTQSIELAGAPGSQGHRTLMVRIDASGKLRASWR